MLTLRSYAARNVTSASPIRMRAGGHRFEPRDHAQRRRLPAARGPEQRDELARCDPERHVVDSGHLAVALRHMLEYATPGASKAKTLAATAAPISHHIDAAPPAASAKAESPPVSAQGTAASATIASPATSTLARSRADGTKTAGASAVEVT
jgi:hypothetical protein